MTTIAVLGAGAWGTALAIHLSARYPVVLWARNAGHVSGMQKARSNPLYLGDFPFGDMLQVSHDLSFAVKNASLLLSAVPTVGFRSILQDLKRLDIPLPPIIWAHKGLETHTAKLPYEVAQEELGDKAIWGVLSGPSFAAELVRDLPTAVTLAVNHIEYAQKIAGLMHNNTLRVYHSIDVVGVSVGGALKNVMAIATGISDGMALGNNARAALITRGLAEITRFGKSLGATSDTFMGLAGLGDLILTCTGQYSRNREVGLQLAQGRPLSDIMQTLGHVAEGVGTTREVVNRAQHIQVNMPITQAVHQIINQGEDAKKIVTSLLAREQRSEATMPLE